MEGFPMGVGIKVALGALAIVMVKSVAMAKAVSWETTHMER